MKTKAILVLFLLLSFVEASAQRIAVAPHANLLVPLFNAGVTVPLGSRLSADATVYYPWLGHDKANSRCLEARGVTLELRWWLAPKTVDELQGNTLTGHSLALGVFGVQADLEWNNHGIRTEPYGAYLDYGYTFRLGRYARLMLSLGVGYARVPWRDYTVFTEGGKLVRQRPVLDHTESYLGPMKAAVSLAIPIIIPAKSPAP